MIFAELAKILDQSTFYVVRLYAATDPNGIYSEAYDSATLVGNPFGPCPVKKIIPDFGSRSVKIVLDTETFYEIKESIIKKNLQEISMIREKMQEDL